MIEPEFSSQVSFETGDFVSLPMHLVQESVLPLVHMHRGEIRTLGSCFAITGDGLCITARHVVEEGAAFLEGHRDLDLERDGAFGALYISSKPHEDDPQQIMGGLLPMVKAYTKDGLDLALVHLQLPQRVDTGEFLRLPIHRLRLRPPAVGEEFLVFGYPKGAWSASKIGNVDYSLDQSFVASRGSVRELHVNGRDSVMLPFPCFRTSARFDGGMSGGPIIGQDGQVFGVVCSEIDTDDGEERLSYGSLIAPALAIGLQGARPGEGVSDLILWDFVQDSAVRADTSGLRIEKREGALLIQSTQA